MQRLRPMNRIKFAMTVLRSENVRRRKLNHLPLYSTHLKKKTFEFVYKR